MGGGEALPDLVHYMYYQYTMGLYSHVALPVGAFDYTHESIHVSIRTHSSRSIYMARALDSIRNRFSFSTSLVDSTHYTIDSFFGPSAGRVFIYRHLLTECIGTTHLMQ